jgi:hypothetical protein
VQVFAAKLSRQQDDGSFKEVESFFPMNLRWAHGQQRPSGPEIFAQGISPKMGKACDLGHVVDPASRKEIREDLPDIPPQETILALDLETKPNTGSHLIPPGIYRLELTVAAANSAPVTKTLELKVTGRWFDDERSMFTDGVGVRVLS